MLQPTSHDFFMNRYSVDTDEFDRGYKAGIAFAKTEGPFNSSPKDVPSAMQKIIETESDSYQKGFLAGYRDRKVRNGRVYGTVFLGFIYNSYDRSHCSRHPKRRIVLVMCKKPHSIPSHFLLCVGEWSVLTELEGFAQSRDTLLHIWLMLRNRATEADL